MLARTVSSKRHEPINPIKCCISSLSAFILSLFRVEKKRVDIRASQNTQIPRSHRCLLAKPQLLGHAADSLTLQAPIPAETQPNGQRNSDETLTRQQTRHNVPVSMVVRAIRILSSPPFLRTGLEGGVASCGTAAAGGARNPKCPPRLQLAVVSVLRVLMSGDGAKYVSAAGAASAADSRAGDGGYGFNVFDEGEAKGEGEDSDSGEPSLFVGLDDDEVKIAWSVSAFAPRRLFAFR